jgi:hypothetical protein
MATSFYELSVPTFLQTVRAVGGFLDRAVRHWNAQFEHINAAATATQAAGQPVISIDTEEGTDRHL